MKTVTSMIWMVIFPLIMTGCGNPNQQTNPGSNLVPLEVTGIWKAQDSEWAFKVEADGSISKVYHPLAGPIRVAEGGSNMEGPVEGTFAMFVMGQCKAEYRPSGRILKATVILESYHFKLPQGELMGHSETYFEGPVSKDGSTWKARMRDYTYLDGADQPDRKMIDENPIAVVLVKVDPASFIELEKPATEDTK